LTIDPIDFDVCYSEKRAREQEREREREGGGKGAERQIVKRD